MASWYCAIDGQECGPFSTDQLRDFARQGQLRPQDHIRRADSEKWTPAAKVRGLFESPPLASPAAPPAAPPAAAMPTAIPLQPVAPAPMAAAPPLPVAGVARSAIGREPRAEPRHRSKRQIHLVVGGLGVALLVLVGVALVLWGGGRQSREVPVEVAETNPDDGNEENVETDVESDPAFATVASSSSPASATVDQPTLPSVRRWLAAGTQKRVIGDHLRLHVAAAWWAASPVPPPTLVVEVEITNISAARPLEYRGWTKDAVGASGETALLAFGPESQPIVVRSSREESSGSGGPQRVAPRQSVSKRLLFSLPQLPEDDRVRLVLPYAALGLPGHVGFEIPLAMVLDAPPGPDAAPVVADSTAGETLRPETPAAQSGDEPETIDDLKAQIAAEADAGQDGPSPRETPEAPAETPDSGAADADMPDTIQDLRRSIEQGREGAPSEEER